MTQGKQFLLQQLSNALVVEQTITQNEQLLGSQIQDPELQQQLQQMANEDQGHVANFQRVIETMGGQPLPPEPEAQTLVSALRQTVETGQDPLLKLEAHGLLKHKAVAAGKMFHALAEQLGNPPSLQPLNVNLQEDQRHEQQLSEGLVKLAQQQATSGGGMQELQQAVAAS
ncbi:MAG: ferritin-like domain-containing protein [Chloroflexota bacterium]|nr:ferritin-like domain-containing protein [Chloroflexota bacterium]